MALATQLTTLENPFRFTSVDIRTAIGPDGEVWFCAKDVFGALEIEWKGASGSLKNCPENWQGVCYLQTPGGSQEAVFISEAAVYQTAFRSNKPEALAFAQWVCSEVLPALRKQGYFGKVDGKDRLAYSKHAVDIAARLVATKDAMLHNFLTAELRDLCNLIGRPMPDMKLLGKDYQQIEMEV